jgi:N-acetylmuramoyl-L-alanine amidase
MRPITEIILHCSDTKPAWSDSKTDKQVLDEIRLWHTRDRGWKDIGYHYVITRNGIVMTGRPIDQVGAHVQGHNTGTIGICLVGGNGGNENDKFDDHFTAEQRAAVLKLIADLKVRFPAIMKVSGHNEYAPKACPCFAVPAFLAEKPHAKAVRASAAQSTTMQAGALQVASAAGAGVSAVSALSGTAQIVALAFCGIVALAALWIMRERLRRWADGDR